MKPTGVVGGKLEWRDGDGETTRIGYVNRNNQRCAGTLGVPGNDHMQFAFKVECLNCGHVYGANGSDLHLRKCPKCQRGQEGIPFWISGKSGSNTEDAAQASS